MTSEDSLYKKMRSLERELAWHRENEGDECPLCVLEAENERWKKHALFLMRRFDVGPGDVGELFGYPGPPQLLAALEEQKPE